LKKKTKDKRNIKKILRHDFELKKKKKKEGKDWIALTERGNDCRKKENDTGEPRVARTFVDAHNAMNRRSKRSCDKWPRRAAVRVALSVPRWISSLKRSHLSLSLSLFLSLSLSLSFSSCALALSRSRETDGWRRAAPRCCEWSSEALGNPNHHEPSTVGATHRESQSTARKRINMRVLITEALFCRSIVYRYIELHEMAEIRPRI